MEVETAARKMLLADDTVKGYVVAKVFKFRLEERVEGTSGRALVVARNNGWATPDTRTTQEYPLLTVKCYADPTRDATGQITAMDAEDKAYALFRVVDRLLHGKRGVWWGGVGTGLLVIGSARWGEPVLVTEKDAHGETAGDPLGDSVYVYAQYALQVVH